MARQQRNDVDYFPHPVSHGKGMFYIRQTHGNDGYVVWMMLLEKLGAADYHYLDLKNDLQVLYLSAELKVNEHDLIVIISDLVRISDGDFNAELWEEERILYNQKFVDSIADAYKKRNNSIIELNILLRRLIQLGRLKPSKLPPNKPKSNLKVPVKPQSKVKESKEEKSIIEFFEIFWDNYHNTTGKPKTDKEAAFKYWKKLIRAERILASKNIIKYFNSLTDPKYCKKARTYLVDKNFNDEFKENTNIPRSVGMRQFKAND